jgi:hypothetical protein
MSALLFQDDREAHHAESAAADLGGQCDIE